MLQQCMDFTQFLFEHTVKVIATFIFTHN